MRWTYFSLFTLLSLVVHVAGLPLDPKLKTKQIRSSTYRQRIMDHKGHTYGREIHADHLFELQQVTGWLNKNNVFPDEKCLPKLKEKMNDVANLDMIDGKINIEKGHAIQKLINPPEGGRSDDHIIVSHEVHQYLHSHEAQIMKVARELDQVLDKPECKNIKGNPMEREAKQMFTKLKAGTPQKKVRTRRKKSQK